MKSMAKKIKTLRDSLDLAQWEFGRKLNPENPVPQATVSKWEAGKQSPDAENMRAIAALAGMSYEEFVGVPTIGVPSAAGRRVPVIGAVQAGSFVEEVEWPEDDRYEVAVPLPDAWASIPVHGFEVRGDSFNRVYPDGAIVYAAPIEHVPGAPQNGNVVIAIRRDHDGTLERTLKEFVVDESGKKWLWPRSTSPEHQAPIPLGGANRRTAEVYIAGIVIAGFILSPAASLRPGRAK